MRTRSFEYFLRHGRPLHAFRVYTEGLPAHAALPAAAAVAEALRAKLSAYDLAMDHFTNPAVARCAGPQPLPGLERVCCCAVAGGGADGGTLGWTDR